MALGNRLAQERPKRNVYHGFSVCKPYFIRTISYISVIKIGSSLD